MSNNPWLFFIDAEKETSELAKQIRYMYFHYRMDTTHQCRTCKFLVHHGGNTKNYLKCKKYGITRGAATDWRAKWDACGLYEEKVIEKKEGN